MNSTGLYVSDNLGIVNSEVLGVPGSLGVAYSEVLSALGYCYWRHILGTLVACFILILLSYSISSLLEV